MPETFKDKVRSVYEKYIRDCKSEFGEAFTVEPLTFIDDVRRIGAEALDPFRLLKTRENYLGNR